MSPANDGQGPLTLAINPATGALVVEGVVGEGLRPLFARLGTPRVVNCGKPRPQQEVPLVRAAEPLGLSLRLHRIYQDSLVDGPGRRVVVQVQGCPLRCPGCYVPATHDADGGAAVDVHDVLETILPLLGAHDGLTILGGEPFAQPLAVATLIAYVRLFREEATHVCVYSGYTLADLVGMGPAHRALVGASDLLIDGPYVAALAPGAGQWRGSSNQGISDRAALTHALAGSGGAHRAGR